MPSIKIQIKKPLIKQPYFTIATAEDVKNGIYLIISPFEDNKTLSFEKFYKTFFFYNLHHTTLEFLDILVPLLDKYVELFGEKLNLDTSTVLKDVLMMPINRNPIVRDIIDFYTE
jgi:hypothetical protein